MTEEHEAVTVEQRMVCLGRMYMGRLPLEMASLREQLDMLDAGGPVQVILPDLYERLYKLAGSGGTFGFDELSSLARVMALQVKVYLVRGDVPPDDAERQWLRDSLAGLDGVASRVPRWLA